MSHAHWSMQVPVTLRALWAQRKRWARGQGEALHAHLTTIARRRNHRMWLIALESLASWLWVWALIISLLIAVVDLAINSHHLLGLGIAWGIAIAVLATVQTTVALWLETSYDPRDWKAYLIEPIYPLAYWTISAAAAVRSETLGLISGPRHKRVVWDIPREQ